MKYIHNFRSAGFIVAVLVFLGCSKKLDTAPFNQIDSGTAFATAERNLLSLMGVYDAAQSGVYDPLNGTANSVRGYPFGAAAIEQQDMRGEDMVNTATFFQITYQGTHTPVSPNNVNMWKELYALINKANICIDGFRGAGNAGILTPAVAAQYEGECRFLRAMAHHELLIHFARPYADGNGNNPGVPYRDFAIQSSASVDLAKNKPRDTVSVVYAKILQDLDYAETNLPATIGAGGINTYRATKAAAIALKMRVKLHMRNWPGVITDGNKLIPATIDPLNFSAITSPIGGWKLTPAVNGPFLNYGMGSTESIFSIKNDPLDNPQTNATLARMYGQNANGGRGLVAISPIAWNLPEWRCDDRRRTLLYVNGITANTTVVNNKFTIKYTDVVDQSDWTPYIRYAEVLLTQSEAEARNASGVSQRAIDLLNAVRNRAIADSLTNRYTAGSFANKNELINAILKERRIEFLAEGKRWGDIHRNAVDPDFSTGGVPAKIGNGVINLSAFVCAGPIPTLAEQAIPYSDYRFLWPIPQQERSTNPIVAQNPGYN